MIVFLYRPSPQVPEPSQQAAERCYDAAVTNINMQSMQIAKKSVDLTWIFTQSLFMALNTILWSLSYASIRRQHPVDEVNTHLATALYAINLTSERWPGVQSALQLYENLIQGCLMAYIADASYVVRSLPLAQDPSSQVPSFSPTSPRPLSSSASHSPHRSSKSCDKSVVDDQSPFHSSAGTIDHLTDIGNDDDLHRQLGEAQAQQQDATNLLQQSSSEQESSPPGQVDGQNSQPGVSVPENYGIADFDSNSLENPFPTTITGLQHWDRNITSPLSQTAFAGYNDIEMDTRPWLGSFGDEYSQYMHQACYPPEQHMQSLSQEEQLELMATLEQAQLPDLSHLISDEAISYDGNIL
jgi:hypothetical protein